MSLRTHISVLFGLLAVLAYLAYSQLGHPSVPGISGVMAADTKFEPLDVREPALRVEELEKLRKQEPSGNHRNIFLAAPPPAPKQTVPTEPAIVGAPFPVKPPPPEPPHVNAEFF